jgi:hypothetical protein
LFTSYEGLFDFLEGSWLDMGVDMRVLMIDCDMERGIAAKSEGVCPR